MPYRVTLEMDSFNGEVDAAESHEDLALLLDFLIARNSNYLRRRVGRDYGQNPAVPLLYASGVRYEPEPLGAEFWRDIPTCLRVAKEGGGSDCEDLVCWQIAELRERFGIPARPVIIPQLQPNGRYLYHIQTWTPDQGIDDPSARLGMQVAPAAAPMGGRFNAMLRAAWPLAA